jgi:hypothetical protein
MSSTVTSGIERFFYEAYPHQKLFHESKARYRLLGGAAGPGKTFALLMDHYGACNRFSLQDAPEVHTLILRRTYPKLQDTVVTRFQEKFPREVYRDFNEQKGRITWHNGATTKLGAMQYEHDVWGYQGQWYRIGYDELTEFTFPQWQNIAAWNRCPVSKHCTKDGATNPVGIGAQWVEDLFVSKRTCAEMDATQRQQYNPDEYAYFPATYLDNPVYANDENWVRGLDAYQAAYRDALKLGKWGVAGGYFHGAWDEAVNVYPAESLELLPHWYKWLSGDWGFDHNFAIYKHCLDDLGIVRTYGELVDNRHDAEQLGEAIAKWAISDGEKPEEFSRFSLSHDAFAKKQDNNPVAIRLGEVLAKHGIVRPEPSTRDALGREQLMYEMLRKRIKTGAVLGPDGERKPILKAVWQIADICNYLIRCIPKAPRDEKNRERVAEFLGDDPLQGAGYGLYVMFGRPAAKPLEMRVVERVQAMSNVLPVERITDPTAVAMMAQKALELERKHDKPAPLFRSQWRRRFRP